MASSSTSSKPTKAKPPTVKTGITLVWLDDNSEADAKAKAAFQTVFDEVRSFKSVPACLELVESADDTVPAIAVLVSGRYGEQIVPNRIQPLNQVKYIYVFCYDIKKHSQWAQKCDKVQCVEADLGKILKCMQQNVQTASKKKAEPMDVDQEDETSQDLAQAINVEPSKPKRFIEDRDLYDQLALQLVLRTEDDDDGVDDFEKFCQSSKKKDQVFKPELSVKQWYRPGLSFTNLNSTDFNQLWTLRWFIRSFHRQLTNEHKQFIGDKVRFSVHHPVWLNGKELEEIKQRISQVIVFTELLPTHVSRRKALASIEGQQESPAQSKVLFEINVDPKTLHTIPYAEIDKDQVLLWFGARCRLTKIEFVGDDNDQEDSYWLVGVNLCPILDSKQSIHTLYDYHLRDLTEMKDVYHALGRLLAYKGLYYQAEKWLQTTEHYEDLAELAIRQNQCERADQSLAKVTEETEQLVLLCSYNSLLLSSDNITKARTGFLRVASDAREEVLKARASTGLGFINLVVSQQTDQALDYFTQAHNQLVENLPDIHPDIAKSLLGLGYTYFAQRQIKKAEKYFRDALHIQQQSLSSHHPDIAKTRNGLAHCLATEKQTINDAFIELDQAMDILIHTFPEQHKKHPEIALTLSDIHKVRTGKVLSTRNTLLDYI